MTDQRPNEKGIDGTDAVPPIIPPSDKHENCSRDMRANRFNCDGDKNNKIRTTESNNQPEGRNAGSSRSSSNSGKGNNGRTSDASNASNASNLSNVSDASDQSSTAPQ